MVAGSEPAKLLLSFRESCLDLLYSNLVTRKLPRLSKKGKPQDPNATPSFLCSPFACRDQSSGWHWACSSQWLRRVARPQLTGSAGQKTLDRSLGHFSCGPAGQSKGTGFSTASQSPSGLAETESLRILVQGIPPTQHPPLLLIAAQFPKVCASPTPVSRRS